MYETMPAEIERESDTSCQARVTVISQQREAASVSIMYTLLRESVCRLDAQTCSCGFEV
jgi:hypothetical protein